MLILCLYYCFWLIVMPVNFSFKTWFQLLKWFCIIISWQSYSKNICWSFVFVVAGVPTPVEYVKTQWCRTFGPSIDILYKKNFKDQGLQLFLCHPNHNFFYLVFSIFSKYNCIFLILSLFVNIYILIEKFSVKFSNFRFLWYTQNGLKYLIHQLIFYIYCFCFTFLYFSIYN